MAKTLLNGVNEVLTTVQLVKGNSGLLTGLIESARQVYIDNAVQAWNETIEKLYSLSYKAKPNEMAEGTITLVATQRDYSLAADLNILRWPLHDRSNGQYITEYPGGYQELVTDQSYPSNYTGLPYNGAIRPTDGNLYLDRIPQAAEAGRVYTYLYDKDVSLSADTDTVPFKDVVFRALVPAVAEIWRRKQYGTFDKRAYDEAMATASRYLTQKERDTSYRPLGSSMGFDPFED